VELEVFDLSVAIDGDEYVIGGVISLCYEFCELAVGELLF
jgi:hypothetical protein